MGIDLASKSWSDNGACVLSFDITEKKWLLRDSHCIKWPTDPMTPSRMATALVDYIRENKIAGLSLDGPQGWREPNASERDGVGRVCEYEARCPGKTGEIGTTYPGPQLGWIQFCIDVFAELKKHGGKIPTVAEGIATLQPMSSDSFWLIECFPTSIWRASGLAVLPGKDRCRRHRVALTPYQESLTACYGLPDDRTADPTHDDLQATVAALPMAGLLGGPVEPIPRGKDSWVCDDGHLVEGVIWDAKPSEKFRSPGHDTRNPIPSNSHNVKEIKQSESSNPITIDDRDEASSVFFNSGISLFEKLCNLHAEGESVGVGYAQFVEVIYSVANYSEVMGRNYATSDTRFVLELASQITEEAGGRRKISRGDVSIKAGMDTFIWPARRPHMRSDAAFLSAPYTKEEWLLLFPDGERCLLSAEQRKINAIPTLGLDLDGTITEAPKFFAAWTQSWLGRVIIITYRNDREKTIADLEHHQIRYDELVLVDRMDGKAAVIAEHGVTMYVDDQPEMLFNVPDHVSVMLFRNEGNFDFADRRWMFSDRTGKQV